MEKSQKQKRQAQLLADAKARRLAARLAARAVKAAILSERIEAGDVQAQEELDDLYWSDASSGEVPAASSGGFYDG